MFFGCSTPRACRWRRWACPAGSGEPDHRKIWQTFAEHFYLFRGTPTGIWLAYVFHEVFGIEDKLTGATAQAIYDQIEAQLATPEFRPRALFERFNIEVLCTTDSATDTLAQPPGHPRLGLGRRRAAHLPPRRRGPSAAARLAGSTSSG